MSLSAIVPSALLTALAVALLALPWSESRAAGLAFLLALMPALGAAVVVAASMPVLARLSAGRERLVSELIILGGASLLLAVFLSGVASVIVIDAALQPVMLGCYAVAALLAIGTVGVGRRLAQGSRAFDLMLARPNSSSVRAAAALLGMLVAVVDATVLSHGYWAFHMAMLGVELCCFAVLTSVSLGRGRSEMLATGVGLACVALAAAQVLSSDAGRLYASALTAPTAYQRLLLGARSLLDHDRDGFSAALGGQDCDDHDARVFPLSPRGRDCLTWMDGAEPPKQPQIGSEPDGLAPQVIVLLTIDAFRCGFEQSERPELLAVCPSLTALAREGQLRLDAHTIYPATIKAMASLHLGSFAFGRVSAEKALLAERLAALGFDTHVVAVHKEQFPGRVKASFRTSDDELLSVARSLSAVTAEVVTERVLAKLKAHEPGRPLFVWAHYLDPHAPYVETPGSHLSTSTTIERFVLEVRRTDAAIGRLARAIRTLPDGDQTLLLVTADHGEGMGEKHSAYHGASIVEPAARIPMLAWSPDPELAHLRARPLPASTPEILPYLLAAAAGKRFESAEQAFFFAHARGGYIYGVYADGWKLVRHQVFGTTELYRLGSDPFEEHDLAASEPDMRERLGRVMAGYVKGLGSGLAGVNDD